MSKHRIQDTHYACQAMIKKYGKDVDCCFCTDHNCQSKQASWEEEIDIYWSSIRLDDEPRTAYELKNFIKTVVIPEERERIKEQLLALPANRETESHSNEWYNGYNEFLADALSVVEGED